MAGTFAKVTATGGLPVPLATIALPRPAGSCFPDLESRNSNRLCLISCRLARTRARMRAPKRARPSNQCVGRAASAGPTAARASVER